MEKQSFNESINWEAVAWYLAGDGSFQLDIKRSARQKANLQPRISALSADPELTETFIDMVDVGQIYIDKNDNCTWYICNQKDVKEFAKKVLPFMPLPRKAEVIKLLIEFCELREKGEYYGLREWEIHKEIKKLNGR